ncbi:MAG: HK97 family phage prohead protease [Cetobacterium sp.]
MLTKTVNFSECQIKMQADSARFIGYASTFGNIDSQNDTIAPGAFSHTLHQHGLPKMFFNHDADAIPIGKWLDARQDSRGLLVEGEFTPGNPQGAAVHAAMKHGTVDGLSIGFFLKKDDFEQVKSGARLIKSVTRLVEISPVTFPADAQARIEQVKSEIESMNDVQDFERLLRDAGGFSREAAKTIVSRAKHLFGLRDAGQEDEAKHEVESIAAFALRAHAVRFPAL